MTPKMHNLGCTKMSQMRPLPRKRMVETNFRGLRLKLVFSHLSGKGRCKAVRLPMVPFRNTEKSGMNTSVVMVPDGAETVND
jgi:hypothetical protein